MDFEGFMAYSGGASHTKTWQARRKKSADDLAGVRETVALARKAGLAREHRQRRLDRHLQYRS